MKKAMQQLPGVTPWPCTILCLKNNIPIVPRPVARCCDGRWIIPFKSRWQTASTQRRIFITSPHAAPHVFQHVSLTRRVPGYSVCHQAQMPDVPDPESLPDDSHQPLYGLPLGVLVESHLDGGFKLVSKVWDSHFEPYVWWWCFIFVGLAVKPPISITKWADAHLRNPSAGKTRWTTLVWKNAVENKNCDKTKKMR